METSASALPRTSPRPETEKSGMKLGTILRRFLTPGFVVTLQGLSKFGAVCVVVMVLLARFLDPT